MLARLSSVSLFRKRRFISSFFSCSVGMRRELCGVTGMAAPLIGGGSVTDSDAAAGAGGGTGGESDTGGEAVIAGDAFEAVAGLGNGGLS